MIYAYDKTLPQLTDSLPLLAAPCVSIRERKFRAFVESPKEQVNYHVYYFKNKIRDADGHNRCTTGIVMRTG